MREETLGDTSNDEWLDSLCKLEDPQLQNESQDDTNPHVSNVSSDNNLSNGTSPFLFAENPLKRKYNVLTHTTVIPTKLEALECVSKIRAFLQGQQKDLGFQIKVLALLESEINESPSL